MPVGKDNNLVRSCEDDIVISDDRAAAYGRDSDFLRITLLVALASVINIVYWLSIASFRLSARAMAVPLGASHFSLWCFSTISISKPASASTFAAACTSFISVFTPRDIFAERRTGISLLVSCTFLS